MKSNIEIVNLFKNSPIEDWFKGDESDDAVFGSKKDLLVTLWSHPRGYELRYGYMCIAIVTGPAGKIIDLVKE